MTDDLDDMPYPYAVPADNGVNLHRADGTLICWLNTVDAEELAESIQAALSDMDLEFEDDEDTP